MKIEYISRSEQRMDECDYRNAFVIKVNDKKILSFFDGEPEDSNMSRDFGDVFSIPSLVDMVYEAVKNGEQIEIIDTESDEI